MKPPKRVWVVLYASGAMLALTDAEGKARQTLSQEARASMVSSVLAGPYVLAPKKKPQGKRKKARK